MIQSVQRGKLSLETTIAELIPEWSNSNKASISLREMLSHYARLTPWIPFYKETSTKAIQKSIYQSKPCKFSLTVANDLFLKSDFGEELYSQIKESELLDTLGYKYSDFPYYILKKYYETTSGLPYDKLIEDSIFKPLGLKNIRFKPLEQFDADQIVPSRLTPIFVIKSWMATFMIWVLRCKMELVVTQDFLVMRSQ